GNEGHGGPLQGGVQASTSGALQRIKRPSMNHIRFIGLKNFPDRLLDQDLRACRASDPIGGLLANLRQIRSTLTADADDFAGALNDRSGLLAVYIACMHRGVLDFLTGAKVLLQTSVDRHHILPRAQFSEKLRSTADNVANIAFIVSDVNKSIGQS